MSAEAPSFVPSSVPSSSSNNNIGAVGDSKPRINGTGGLSGKDGDGIIGTNIDAPVRAAMANAIAASRVTRPLPGSRRAQVGADFVPKAPEAVKGLAEKEGTRRLIVVLSQVSIDFGFWVLGFGIPGVGEILGKGERWGGGRGGREIIGCWRGRHLTKKGVWLCPATHGVATGAKRIGTEDARW